MAVTFSAVISFCPDSCYCNDLSSVCYLENCQDEIPWLPTNELQIYGYLCRVHRQQLMDESYKETVLVLYDDYCLELNYCL